MPRDRRPVKTSASQAVLLPYDGSEVGTVFQAAAGEMTLAERSAILRKASERVSEATEDLALGVSSECGKPIKEARGEVQRSAQTLLFSAEEAHRLHGEVVPMEASEAGKGRYLRRVRTSQKRPECGCRPRWRDRRSGGGRAARRSARW